MSRPTPAPGDPEPPGGEITFRRLLPADFPMLASWLDEPHVHRWWFHDTAPEDLDRDFGPGTRGEEPGEDLVVLLEGTPIGLVQRSFWHDYPEYLEEIAPAVTVPLGAVTIDYLIGRPGLTGRGLGTRVITAIVRATWTELPQATTVIVPVAKGNPASWRALEKAGFTRIAEADLEPDNPIDDRDHVVYRIDRPRA